MWGSPAGAGDWIKINETTPVSATDHLMGSGLPTGTRGVVTNRRGNQLEVEFETGFGRTKAIVSAAKCSVVKRGGGRYVVLRRAGTVETVRIALGIFLSWPIIQFAAMYWWEKRTFDGIVEEFTVAAVESAGDWIMTLIQQPLPSLIYAAFITVLSRFAFRR